MSAPPASPRRRLVALALIAAAPFAAQSVPSTINYQGRLTDNTPQQAPLNATVNMQFAIYDAANAGALLWVEPLPGSTPVTVTNGVFNVLLGGNGVPIPPSVFSGGATRYLLINVNGETLAPRQAISATGYANQADNSGRLGGVAPAGWQRSVNPPACPAGQFYGALAADGAAGCAAPPPGALTPPVSLTDNNIGAVLTARNDGAGAGLYGLNSTTGYAVRGAASDGIGVFGTANGANGGDGVVGSSLNGRGGYFAVTGGAANNNPALMANTNGPGPGIQGLSPVTGVLGIGGQGGSTGVIGMSYAGDGNGVRGIAQGTGYGVRGESMTGNGVWGISPNGYAVVGQSTTSRGVFGLSDSGRGVLGYSASGNGVHGETGSPSSYGLYTPNRAFAEGGYQQPGANREALTMVRGIVRADGSIAAGSGFTASRNDVGDLTIHFDSPFSGVPAVLTVPNAGGLDQGVYNPNAQSFEVLTSDPSNGDMVDVDISFLAVGPP